MLSKKLVDAISRGDHGDPFSVLGPHLDAAGVLWIRSFQPGARSIKVLDCAGGEVLAELKQRHPDGFFEGALGERPVTLRYRLRIDWGGPVADLEDAFRFPPILGELDVWLLAEGTHYRPYERLGAHLREIDGVAGVAFAVWAPNAQRVSVVGDFNRWDGRCHPMRLRRECGVWEIFVPSVGPGTHYKYEIRAADGSLLPLKADPYGFRSEMRPATASIVHPLPPLVGPGSPARKRANGLDVPMSIYEVHLGSWRRDPQEPNRFLDWNELADQLVPYARDMGFTHLELMPVSEHPFDGSWGYQPLGLYAPSARFGPPEGFRSFIQRCHEAQIGVIIDWVPGHFPADTHGLGYFDGSHLFEHQDPREGFHRDWNTLIYNFGRNEVRNFLIGNALYWVERYGVDGLRVDAVASMLYRDYSRPPGEWIPNYFGGRENLEAIAFMRRTNEVVGIERPEAVMFAEESTAWPMVSRPPSMGGLGFHFKWNMGWMHDTLRYMSRESIHRKYHHHELTFGLTYAFHENFVLPISHDEVVHGKGSLLGRMPGDRAQRFSNLRTFLGFMYGHPGKKLLFMGCEFAQEREWNHAHSLDWHLLADPLHAGVQQLVRDLNGVYRELPALHRYDFDIRGFQWIDCNDCDNSVLSFVRTGDEADHPVVVVCNLTPVARQGYRIGVPRAGYWRERINTDSQFYGGSNVGNPGGGVQSAATPMHGRPWSVGLRLPPLATLILEWVSP